MSLGKKSSAPWRHPLLPAFGWAVAGGGLGCAVIVLERAVQGQPVTLLLLALPTLLGALAGLLLGRSERRRGGWSAGSRSANGACRRSIAISR